MRKSVKLTALAAVLTVATACGGGGGGSAGGGVTDLKVGIVPFSPDAVLFLAQKNGIFAKHNLDVTTEQAASSAPIVASMVAGQLQFGFVATPVLINANAQGTGVKCVAPVDGQVAPDRDSSALVARAGSGIDSLGHMSGRTVAVVQLSSINLIGAQKLISDAGATRVKYIAMPFPQMPQALADGRVDAAVIASPYVETALNAGAVALAHPSSDLFPNGTVYCYAATAGYLEQNPEVAQNFQAAMNEAINYSKDHEDEAKATLVDGLGLTPEQAKAQIIPSNYVPEINVGSISDIQNLMADQKAIEKKINVADLVWHPAG